MSNQIINERIYIIGYMGTDRWGYAMKLAEKKGFSVLSVDDEIQRLDGRSIKRICMVGGEHAYRNMEYEILAKLNNPLFDTGLAKNEVYPEKLVVACGDGIVLDDMCLEILENSETIFLTEDIDLLYEKAEKDETIPYAFMLSGNADEKKQNFKELYAIREPLYLKAAE